jgi:hypothetical protein
MLVIVGYPKERTDLHEGLWRCQILAGTLLQALSFAEAAVAT